MSSHKAIIDTPAVASATKLTFERIDGFAKELFYHQHPDFDWGAIDEDSRSYHRLHAEQMLREEAAANAALIVRAVNSHDTLVKAFEDVLFALEATEACLRTWNGGRGSPVNFEGMLERARAALTGAK